MRKMKFITINKKLYTVARDIEDMAEHLGGYDAYVFDGDTAGPRHPGTVVVGAARAIIKDPITRRTLRVELNDFARLELGVHKPNDDCFQFMQSKGMVKATDTDREHRYINVFSFNGALAIINYLRKCTDTDMLREYYTVFKKQHNDCILDLIPMDKKGQEQLKRKGTLF